MERIITSELLTEYEEYLYQSEKSTATIKKYLCDIKKLVRYAAGEPLNKTMIIAFKEDLLNTYQYKISSINSFLVASNLFFEYMGWYDLKVKIYKVQKEAFYPDDKCLYKQEYFRLLQAAKKIGKPRLNMIIQTICATGMRVSELKYITVASVKNNRIEIRCKGKVRTILLPDDLRRELLYYIHKNNIKSGCVFCSASGKAVHRSNIWREMKALCKTANVDASKVFPHNLRHLFAQCFYSVKKDIAKLADVLGHSSIETTRIYIKTSRNEYRKQLNQLNLVWGH